MRNVDFSKYGDLAEGVNFFEPLPPEPDRQPAQPSAVPAWVRPPEDQVPVPLPVGQQLARVPGAALVLRRVDVYREGVEFIFRLDLRLESDLNAEQQARIGELLSPRGHRPGGSGQLRVGVALADGTRADATTGSIGYARPTDEPRVPSLTFNGGRSGGANDRWTTEVGAWLWPLPPSGVLTLHFVCAMAGIAEGAVEIDSTDARYASNDVLDTWAA